MKACLTSRRVFASSSLTRSHPDPKYSVALRSTPFSFSSGYRSRTVAAQTAGHEQEPVGRHGAKINYRYQQPTTLAMEVRDRYLQPNQKAREPVQSVGFRQKGKGPFAARGLQVRTCTNTEMSRLPLSLEVCVEMARCSMKGSAMQH